MRITNRRVYYDDNPKHWVGLGPHYSLLTDYVTWVEGMSRGIHRTDGTQSVPMQLYMSKQISDVDNYDAHRVWLEYLRRDLYDRLIPLPGYETWFVEPGATDVFNTLVCSIIYKLPDIVGAEAYERDFLSVILAELMIHGDAPSLGMSLWQVFRHGYAPVRWCGQWPQGYCLAYCPPSSRDLPFPEDCRPTEEQLAQGAPVVFPPRPAPKPVADVPVVSPDTWETLAADPDPRAAFLRHFAFLADPGQEAVLEEIAGLVTSISMKGSQLRVDLRAPRPSDEGQIARILCSKPFTGKIVGLPPSQVRFLRHHNGLRGDGALLGGVKLLPYKAGIFQAEAERWHTPDPYDANTPFPYRPILAPMSSEGDLWAYSQTQEFAPGEPMLHKLHHDGGHCGKALPYSASGYFLRYIHWLLCSELIDDEDLPVLD